MLLPPVHTHTAQRLDPMKGNDESKHDTCNGDCMVYCLAASCGFGWVYVVLCFPSLLPLRR
jgi:hypothetical protein